MEEVIKFEAIFSDCGFSVADGGSKVKKVLQFVDSLGLDDDEFSLLLFCLRKVEFEQVIDKKLEALCGNTRNRGGESGETGEDNF